jgi:hypothetical protein
VSNRLQQLRLQFSEKKTDLQRLYKFRFSSLKLKIYNVNVYIVGVSHPQFQFSNEGDYRGLITNVTKPNEIAVSFLEDTNQTVNAIFNTWDNMKYDHSAGIHYPKAAYEDTAHLVYLGESTLPDAVVADTRITGALAELETEKTRRYVLKGFYPINRDSVTLGYSNNEVEILNVTFNVDNVIPYFGALTTDVQSFSKGLAGA